MTLVDRRAYRQQIQDSLARFRVTALLGPRQCGKTTLARSLATGSDSYFDLEDPVDLARLEAPRQTLGKLTGLVIIDEIQHRPDLFPLLRVLADRFRLASPFSYPGQRLARPGQRGVRVAGGAAWLC